MSSTECFVTVLAEDQPPVDMMTDGFAISAWILTRSNTAGYVLSKIDDNASKPLYTLNITVNPSETESATVSFMYSTENQVVRSSL